MFEALRTTFKLAVASLTLNRLLVIGACVLFLMIIWNVLSLVFNKQVTCKKRCIAIIRYLSSNDVTAQNYSKFISMWENLPTAMRFGWHRYETKKIGKPSDYLKQHECVDLYLNGGIQKQNRSLMRTVIYIVTVLVAMCSISLIGTTTSVGSTTAVLTTTLIADAIIIPLVIFFALMVNYYVYTAIRHLQYKQLVDTFYDFVDYLDQKIDIDDIFGRESNVMGLVSTIYCNETLQEIVEEKKVNRNKEAVAQEVRVGKNGLTNLKAGVLGVSETTDNTANNVIKSYEPMSNKLSSKSDGTEKTPDRTIKSEAQFIEVVTEVEDLLNAREKEKSKSKRTEIDKTVNTKIKALTEYKQKAKANKEVSTIKKTKSNKK